MCLQAQSQAKLSTYSGGEKFCDFRFGHFCPLAKIDNVLPLTHPHCSRSCCETESMRYFYFNKSFTILLTTLQYDAAGLIQAHSLSICQCRPFNIFPGNDNNKFPHRFIYNSQLLERAPQSLIITSNYYYSNAHVRLQLDKFLQIDT